MEHELLHKIHEDVSYLKGRFDSVIPPLIEGHEKYGERIGKLESAENYRKGIAASISFVISFIGVAINFLIGKK